MKPTIRVQWGLALILCGTVAAPPAIANDSAFVSRYGGNNVTIMRSGQAIPVRVQMLISAGETISTGPESFVEVRYLADGCTLRVASGRSIVVGSSSPCAASKQEKQTQALAPPATPAEARPREDVVARVTDTSGPLTRANFGNGLVELPTGTELRVGHTVFAGQSSTITLYYLKADCEHTVPAENYLAIREPAPCQKAQTDDNGSTSATANKDLGLALGATAVLAGGGALAVLLLTDDEDDAESPATPQ